MALKNSLSVRSRHVLKRYLGGEYTAEDVAALTESELLEYENLGPVSVNEIKTWLENQ